MVPVKNTWPNNFFPVVHFCGRKKYVLHHSKVVITSREGGDIGLFIMLVPKVL